MNYAVLFPGQGSQAVGMCQDVRAARPDLFGDAANTTLGWNLNELIENGPQEILTETQHAQPALFATSYALYDEFASMVSAPPRAAAGHSLGEYTAFAAAGALSYLDGLALVAKRGRLWRNVPLLNRRVWLRYSVWTLRPPSLLQRGGEPMEESSTSRTSTPRVRSSLLGARTTLHGLSKMPVTLGCGERLPLTLPGISFTVHGRCRPCT